MGKRMDHGAVADRNAGTDHHERFDGHVVAEGGIRGEVDRIGRDHGDAGVERRLAQSRLHHLFGLGELGLGVDAAHLILAGFNHDGLPSQIPHDPDGVGQIVFALAVGIADPVDDRKRPAAVERHHAGIAERDRPFRSTGVGLFADRHQMIALDQQAAIAGGIGGAKSKHGERGAILQRRPQPRQGVGGDQRRVAERHNQVVRATGNGVPGCQYRVRGAAALALHKSRGVRPQPLCL